MFGVMSLHTVGEVLKYALVWAATLALGPALALTTGLLAFMMLPCAVIGLPFLMWALLAPRSERRCGRSPRSTLTRGRTLTSLPTLTFRRSAAYPTAGASSSSE